MLDHKSNRTFDRLFVAMVTPLKANYDIDEDALRKFLRYFAQPKFVDAGGAIIINPEAGEIFYMSRQEKRRNVEIAMEECGAKMPVFAGVCAPRTEEMVEVAKDIKEVGADGLFLMPPMGAIDIVSRWDVDKYPEVFIDMAKAITKIADMPAIVHPVAAVNPVFGMGFPLAGTLQICKQVPNIVGWKMIYSYPGSVIIAKGLRGLDRHIALLRSSAQLFHENMATGYLDGTATGSFNFGMEKMVDHLDAWRQEDVKKATNIWKSGLEELQYYIYSDYSRLHVRYKLATWIRGLIPLPFMRPPMPKPNKQEISTLKVLIAKAGLDVLSDDEINRIATTLER